ncbi:adventurous gliding motility protein AgmC [Hyalangium rubrum]|uniref:Hemagglutinin n=1 Tax=Hyalangium rubrum TaxID=3103134 RepID=A0ABU5GZ30_9BACT|nr:hemagglutinin [Hyalangium sp. s54d21]MDY7226134.1 hemagglutinin [Hyalangium sp. s54d21]
MRTVPLLVALLVSSSAFAEPDTFGLGTGRSGFLRLDSPQSVIVNRYAQVTAAAAAGTRNITLSSPTTFIAGELVLVHQSAGLTPVPASGEQRAITLSPLGNSNAVGRFEYARVEALTETGLRLTAPLLYGYAANVTQVVSVPEYTELEVRTGATLRAAPWDGTRGGILAVLVQGRLRNDGVITTDGLGFQGGAFLNHTELYACAGLDEPVTSGGAYKGEGLVAGSFGTASGRGNLANAGGGGLCHNAGGGGGGHGGVGGGGGRSAPADTEREVGGLGGAPVAYVPYERLVFGGGGGAGEGNNDLGTPGAAGGGLMLLRALEVRGSGVFRANGATPPLAADDGAGGGGAGGAISLRAVEEVECGRIEARGGAGGSVTEAGFPVGPGGGGGGGVLFRQGETFTCATSVLAGAPGVTPATGGSHGAGPAVLDGGTAVGFVQTVQVPFRLPNTPAVTQPVDGATGVSPRPTLAGTAESGVLVHLFLDGVAYRQVVPGNDGVFSFTPPTDLAPGEHQLAASAEVLGVRSPVSAANRFSVVMPADAGTPDAGTPDAGTPDAGLPDGGTGTPDGGGESPGGLVRPVVVVPAEGEGVDPTPLVAGTSASGVTVSIEVDEVEVARVPRDEQGRFRYLLSLEQALVPGVHRVTARAWDEAGTAGPSSLTTNFEVLEAPELSVGCGCGASPGVGLGVGALLLAAWAARRRE